MDWAEKYRPLHLADILGNNAAVKQMNDWAARWTPDSRPLLLTGKPGIGKTSAALALARDYNWEVLELNASDARTKTIIERVAGNSSQTASLFGSDKKLIVIDEADNLEGNADRGGAKAIAEILKDARQPVLLIANDAYGVSDSIRKLCDTVIFRAITATTLARRLKEICAVEHVSATEESLLTIAEAASGDMRSAVNMLFGSAAGKQTLQAADVNTSQKDERATIFDLAGGVFTGASDARLQKLSRECEEKPDTVMQWIEESLPLINNPARRSAAYRRISRADVYLGRTMRRQYYMMWRYATGLMTSGVAAENEAAPFRPRIMPPSRWRRMGTAKKQKIVRRSLSAILSEDFAIPDAQVQSTYMDLLSVFAGADAYAFCEEHNLDADQLTVLIHDKTRAGEVFKAVQKAAKEREMKVKKAAAAKKKTEPKKAAEKPLDLSADKAPAAAPAFEADKTPAAPPEPVVEEKKQAVSQMTLDFF
ncbi:MAG TPA: replication factor C large subunit [Methanocorpusculum sp.]|nr:replication factor C large subunit [Methanocorpusculum sp.]